MRPPYYALAAPAQPDKAKAIATLIQRRYYGQPTAAQKKKGLRIAAQAFDRITNIGRDGRI
ncbi:hypothetical protein K4043_05255 [Stenotrophomonas sp. SRS1]|uniref:hypothetical protein n=1 Tax=Stenotrophomonas sp. SRS1 TaxID=2870345 RepID=UPI002238B627|nr:hypothetical protein [Stenotrophomonas sp. SRS1]MCW6027415.1 hypothetical protein [Stenotrophomonas sp. SRS1]